MKVWDRQSKHSPAYFIDEKKPSRFFAVVACRAPREGGEIWRAKGRPGTGHIVLVWYFLYLPHLWAFWKHTRCMPACRACLSLCFALHRIRLTREKSPKMCGAGSAPLALTMMWDGGPCLGNLERVGYFRTVIRHRTQRTGSFNNSVFVFGEIRHLATKEEGLRFSTKAFPGKKIPPNSSHF